MLISQMIKGCKEKFFINQIFDENIRRLHQGKKFLVKKHFFDEKLFSLIKTSDIFVKNLVNKKLLLAAFYHLTYYIYIYIYIYGLNVVKPFLLDTG